MCLAASSSTVASVPRTPRLQIPDGFFHVTTHGVDETVLTRAFRPSPIVTVLDGHPHTLAFLGTIHGMPVSCLGVSTFGQGGGQGAADKSTRTRDKNQVVGF